MRYKYFAKIDTYTHKGCICKGEVYVDWMEMRGFYCYTT